jgi:hypothetical protein
VWTAEIWYRHKDHPLSTGLDMQQIRALSAATPIGIILPLACLLKLSARIIKTASHANARCEPRARSAARTKCQSPAIPDGRCRRQGAHRQARRKRIGMPGSRAAASMLLGNVSIATRR